MAFWRVDNIQISFNIQLGYNNKLEELKKMFINAIKTNKKRHHTLTLAKGSPTLYARSFKSNENLKISPIIASSSKKQNFVAFKQKQNKLAVIHPSYTRNRQNAPFKLFQKMNPLKLQITPHLNKITESTTHTQIQNQTHNDMKNLVQKMIRLILENHLITPYNPSTYIIKIQNLYKLLSKICLSLLDNDHPEDELAYLNDTLKGIKSIITNAHKELKSRKNKMEVNLTLKETNNYSESINRQQQQLQKICMKRMNLQEECKHLQYKKSSIQQHNRNRILTIEQQTTQMHENLQKISQQEKQLLSLNETIQAKQKMLQYVTSQTNNILHYVQNQKKNKLVQLASEHYKLIESQIYEYAVYLQANELANSLHYESLPIKYYNSVIDSLEQSLKTINKNIINNEEMSIKEKERGMRDFVLKMHDAYQKKEGEIHKALDFKTKCIIKFVDMMKKWLDNWTLKQEYLVSLREQFAAGSLLYEKCIETIKFAIQSKSIDGIEKEYHCIRGLYAKLKQNYLLGNSFY